MDHTDIVVPCQLHQLPTAIVIKKTEIAEQHQQTAGAGDLALTP